MRGRSLTTDRERFVSLSTRLRQDGFHDNQDSVDDNIVPKCHDNIVPKCHDNIVPRYSALASSAPTRLVLTGVWLIFAPSALWMIGIALSMIADAPDPLSAMIASVLPALFFTLAILILYTQTHRYTSANSDTQS